MNHPLTVFWWGVKMFDILRCTEVKNKSEPRYHGSDLRAEQTNYFCWLRKHRTRVCWWVSPAAGRQTGRVTTAHQWLIHRCTFTPPTPSSCTLRHTWSVQKWPEVTPLGSFFPGPKAATAIKTLVCLGSRTRDPAGRQSAGRPRVFTPKGTRDHSVNNNTVSYEGESSEMCADICWNVKTVRGWNKKKSWH